MDISSTPILNNCFLTGYSLKVKYLPWFNFLQNAKKEDENQ